MAPPRKSHDYVSTNNAVSSVDNDKGTGVDPINPSALGFTKVAYAVDETLELLSIGRTALYAAVKRGDLDIGCSDPIPAKDILEGLLHRCRAGAG
jgi:hypothetical protein